VIDDPEVSPGCTDFCTGGGTARGHRRTSESDLYAMGMTLDHAGIPYKDGIADHDLPAQCTGSTAMASVTTRSPTCSAAVTRRSTTC
jgi:hypothetical protein